MGELIIHGLNGEIKKIDLAAKTTEDVMKEMQDGIKEMAKAESEEK